MVLHGENGVTIKGEPGVGAIEKRDVGSVTPSGRVSRSTVKPWFMDVISTLPVVKS